MVGDEEFQALQQRVDRLERIVSGVDADMAAVQAQRRADFELPMALRGTQLEQGEQINRITEQLGGLTDHVDGLTVHVDGLTERVDRGFAEVRSGLEAITGLIGRLLPGEES